MFEKGEIVILSDGRIFQVLINASDAPYEQEGKILVQFIDSSDEVWLSHYKLDIMEQSVKSSSKVNYHLARSVHLRLNNE